MEVTGYEVFTLPTVLAMMCCSVVLMFGVLIYRWIPLLARW